MANLDLIEHFREKYSPSSPKIKTKAFAFLNESFSPADMEKALSNEISGMGVNYTRYFDMGLPAEVALLFIDVCGFSTRHGNLVGEEIADFFHDYYDIIIPIIYKNGGVVEKIIGDGIVAVFGQPFLDAPFLTAVDNADTCAKKIIKATKNTRFSSKVAFHAGTINYFKNKTGFYSEFTMIGKLLTELFRLESIAKNDCINYYGDSEVRSYYTPHLVRGINSNTPWINFRYEISNLKGVNYDHFYAIHFNG